MKNVLRIAAVVLPLVGSTTFAFAQSNPDLGAVTGSENSIREVIGEPQLRDDGGLTGRDRNFDRGNHNRPHRTHVR
jgi:hypothetical protein